MTQKQLAKMVGCSEQFMGRIEHGAVPIPEHILIKCIQILDLRHEKLKKFYRVASETKLDEIFAKIKTTKKRRGA